MSNLVKPKLCQAELELRHVSALLVCTLNLTHNLSLNISLTAAAASTVLFERLMGCGRRRRRRSRRRRRRNAAQPLHCQCFQLRDRGK
jgi:hypothetical protein